MAFDSFFYIISDMLRILKYSSFKMRFKYQKSDKNEIIIVGTGPSMDKSLGFLKRKPNTVYFAVNDFAKSEEYTAIKPRNYIFMDSARWANKEDISERDFFNREDTFRRIIEETNWDMNIFVPSYVVKKRLLDRVLVNEKIHIIPFNNFSINLKKSRWLMFLLKHNYCAPFNNVLAGAIYISINMGYHNIGIIGAEHSWTKDLRVTKDNIVCTIKRHFYSEKEELVPWLKSNNERYGLAEVLHDLYKHFVAYEVLSEYAKIHGSFIVNYTEDSFIDAFEKRSLLK